MPNATARRATSDPILPRPTIPSVLPYNSAPTNRSQPPRRSSSRAQPSRRGLDRGAPLHGMTQLGQDVLQSLKRREDLRLLHISHVSDAEDYALELALTACQRDAVILPQPPQQRLPIDPRRQTKRGRRSGGAGRTPTKRKPHAETGESGVYGAKQETV